MELDLRGAELPFQVLTDSEEKNSVAMASNESSGEWTKTFTDPRPCAAIVDRLTFGGNLIQTGTESYVSPSPSPGPQRGKRLRESLGPCSPERSSCGNV